MVLAPLDPSFIYSILILKKHLWTYQTVCKALLKRGYMTGYLRRSLKGFRAEGDIDTIMSVLFYVSVIASGTFMTRPVVPGAPRLI